MNNEGFFLLKICKYDTYSQLIERALVPLRPPWQIKIDFKLEEAESVSSAAIYHHPSPTNHKVTLMAVPPLRRPCAEL